MHMLQEVKRALYPITKSAVEWLSNELIPIEAGTFCHWRTLRDVAELCDRAQTGSVPKFVALAALEKYNQQHKTRVTYQEVVTRQDFSFAGAGDWVAYVRSREEQEILLFGQYSDPNDAFLHAPPTVSSIYVWNPTLEELVVYRSFYLGHRTVIREEPSMSWGLQRGPALSFVLPPEIEGSVIQDLLSRPNEANEDAW